MAWRNINLAANCPLLRSLHFTLFVGGLPQSFPSDSAQWEYALFILTMTSKTSLRHITFGLFCNGGLLGLSSAPDWMKVDTVLSSFRCLHAAQFHKETREADNVPMAKHAHPIPCRWEEFIKEKLPTAHAAGTLRFL